MARLDAYDEPLQVDVVDSEVVLIGPGPVGVALTPSAAAETASRLSAAVEHARQAGPDEPHASQAIANDA